MHFLEPEKKCRIWPRKHPQPICFHALGHDSGKCSPLKLCVPHSLYDLSILSHGLRSNQVSIRDRPLSYVRLIERG